MSDTQQPAGNSRPVPGPEINGQPDAPPVRDDTISLLDLLTVLAKHWKLIFFTSFFAAIGVVLFSLYTIRMPPDSPYNPLPNVYRPEAQILLTDPSSGPSLSGLLGAGDLGALTGLMRLGGAGSASAALAQELLRGNTIIDQVIDEFGLLQVFAGSEFPRTAARRSIRENMTVSFDERSRILKVSYLHIDPVYATDILQRVVMLLESRFTYLTRDDARARTEAVQIQIEQLEAERDAARDALITFQRRYGIIDPENQGRETIELIANFKMQILEQELERDQILRLVVERDDPQIQRIDRNIARLRSLVTELESGFRTYSRISIPLNEIGPLTAQFADLRRDLLLKEQIYSTFQTELIKNRIASQDTTRVFQVIEPPEVPEVKASPSRGTISVIVTVTAFFVSVFLAFVVEYFARARQDPTESGKLEVIRDQFRIRRRA